MKQITAIIRPHVLAGGRPARAAVAACAAMASSPCAQQLTWYASATASAAMPQSDDETPHA
jgi:hypothetical protein